MSKVIRAIALCRVSSTEQLKNNSLKRQKDAITKAAKELNVVIPKEYWWSGSVSSLKGKNLTRKDISEIQAQCKKDKSVKYILVDEPDRFMRSVDEAIFFEVTFRNIGVTIWYASDPELNKGDLSAKLLKFTKYLTAEGSNEERQRKSISGQVKALMEGRYPFNPKPGYMRGQLKAIPEVHPVRGPALQKVLLDIVNKRVTPSQGLVNLNHSAFMKDGHAPYKMDKFRKIVIDPFNAGVVESDKQVRFRNENGLHEKLITLQQHQELVRIMDTKKKNQNGPRKGGNRKFPLNVITAHDICIDKKNKGKLVGFDHGNGHSKALKYEKYRCRTPGCGKYWTREEAHNGVVELFDAYTLSDKGSMELIRALDIVWKRNEAETELEVNSLRRQIKTLTVAIEQQVEAAIDPSNRNIKDNILLSIDKKKNTVGGLENKVHELVSLKDHDKASFLDFALSFINDMGSHFLETSKENRLRCKQIVFPNGFRINSSGKVYTTQISPLYRLATKKKDAEASDMALMVPDSGRISNR
jgi:DNA invertase Pin-like site-specific DNA recombinase